jgi:phosphate transport system permease protein
MLSSDAARRVDAVTPSSKPTPTERPQFSAFRRQGLPAIWVSGMMVLLILVLLGGMVGIILVRGLKNFWPQEVVKVETADGAWMGPVRARETVNLGDGNQQEKRLQLWIGNRDLYGLDFRWFAEKDIQKLTVPKDAVVVERYEHGNFHGMLQRVEVEGKPAVTGPQAWKVLQDDIGKEQREDHSAHNVAVFKTADGTEKEIWISDIVRAWKPNRMSWVQKVGHYVAKGWEFVVSEPRESNTEGGIFPALYGTVFMVFLMTLVVVPLGVVAALYLSEYARDGIVLRTVRLAISNLAGVPSIVFGMFGLAFFVYGIGGTLDSMFFSDSLPSPTFGTGGILWASLTLALLTLPVVVVATEEGLAAVPRAHREGSLALGATHWQTLWHVVLPQAMPGILTGVILAIGRAAGEVAPLMLTGVVKLAPSLPLDAQAPFLHLERKFMHLGFHIYDVSMQSPNVEAAKPMVYSTTLLLLVLVIALNAMAIVIRNRLNRRYRGAAI